MASSVRSTPTPNPSPTRTVGEGSKGRGWCVGALSRYGTIDSPSGLARARAMLRWTSSADALA